MNQYLEIFLTQSPTLYDKNCVGCKRHEKDVMLTFYDNKTFHDVFLTQEQFDAFRTEVINFKQRD
jgi:hypothetical protein